jgi:hypothetical protein
MALWGNIDNAANSCVFAVAQYNKSSNSLNQTAFFGNTTPDAYYTGVTVGQFGADTTEVSVANGSLQSFTVTFTGSGYLANTTVTVSGNGTANATANSTGRISSVNVTANGSNYFVKPIVTIAAPTAVTFNGNTAVSGVNKFITLATNPFLVNDRITYSVTAGNTVISPLTNNAVFFVALSNSSGIQLTSTLGNTTPISVIPTTVSETGQKLTGETATAEGVLTGVKGHYHAGWVVRTVGSGGRAGRVSYETLVAMGSMSSDAEDDILKDL